MKDPALAAVIRRMAETDARLATLTAQVRAVEAATMDMAGAIERAGFRVAPDLLGKPTLWCVECGRDSGAHRETCKKSRRLPW